MADLPSDLIKADYGSLDRQFDLRLAGRIAHQVKPALDKCGTNEAVVVIKAGIDQYKLKIDGF